MDAPAGSMPSPCPRGRARHAAPSEKVFGILKEPDSQQGNGCRNIDCTRWLVAGLVFVSLSIFFIFYFFSPPQCAHKASPFMTE